MGPVRGWKRAIPPHAPTGREESRNLPACLALGVHFSARVWSLSIPFPHPETGWLPSPKPVICDPNLPLGAGSTLSTEAPKITGGGSVVLGLS